MKSILTILTLALVLILAACDSSQPAPQQPNQPAAQQQAGQPTSVQETGGQQTEPSGTSFADFALANKQATYKVTYDFTTKSTETMSGTMTMAHKAGNQKIKTELSAGTSEMFIIGNSMYACSDAAGETKCFKLDSPQQDSGIKMMEGAQDNPNDYAIEKMNTVTIAGTVAQCFRITAKKEDVQSDVCYESHGVPLYMKSTGTEQGVTFESTMQATSFSLTVADSEFELPAEPVDLGQMMQGVPSGQMPDLSQYT